MTGKNPDEAEQRGDRAATEEHATTVPFLLQGKERRPLRELRTQVKDPAASLLAKWETALCKTRKKESNNKRAVTKHNLCKRNKQGRCTKTVKLSSSWDKQGFANRDCVACQIVEREMSRLLPVRARKSYRG